MKNIRWGGLVGFLVITGLVVTVALLFAGGIIKSLMESSLSDMNGAKVDIEEVRISYSPLAMEVSNIQIADPAQAMINTAEIEQIKFVMSFGSILLGKVIIDEASINGIQIDTPRKESGLITKETKTKEETASEESESIAMPELDLPDVSEILSSESLLSDKLISELEADISNTEAEWKKITDSLPDKSKSDLYEARYKKIQKDSKGNLKQKLAAIKDAKQLSKDLKAEAKNVKLAKDTFSTDLKRITAELKEVKAAPSKDISRIKNKYHLDNLNAENIAQMLFGEQVAEYTVLAQKLYARIEPYLSDDEEEEVIPVVERSKGIDVVFKEFDPKPDMYVRLASITANLPRGQFDGSITAISSDQSINKEPTRFKVQGVALTNKESEKITGEFNYIDENNGFSKFNYALVKSQIDDFEVSKSSKLPLTMKQAKMDFSLDAKIQRGSLSGTSATEFNQVSFDSGDSSSMLASSFDGIESFDIGSQFSGSIDDLSINISSNLDDQLGQQLKNKLNQKKQEFEKELRASVDEKLKEPLAKIEAKKAKLDAIKNKVEDRQKQLQQRIAALKETISKQSEQKKNDAKDKLKNKLKDKFGF